ncbi:N-acetylmannosamine-6-phosphate 2-epimerase [Firmicutes bacterium AM43-11BH]|jgi:N-acylglucosamine-6-phosphate 2-epimerase|uniref:Putative N-acetylmannosamine-6-phosphate 2-epimerase n=1 Tax=Ruminococcus hominis TaxID=2763065 RepID=A0ABR7G708_9FIRM|nr:N-acetylmannosamine-6-phosphate 2-epimerase [Ruminococcus hominis]MBC5682546.1 N-acetylmannosamine-6-phosphate 2-epimerase [Ruminococcus hominis]RHS77883.1 N-acetylmannosamine-6-phosphate 2-epimerase [Firmicutes bacterium AM43-11BH]CDA14915.1 putative N-acetylmannosamine-6-phosphate 2-epimerase [Firmicutes bacterium CAG:212]
MDERILDTIRGGLIVSCQALENEPLHSSYIMQRMAVAAMYGGAVGIRANSVSDILEIRKEVKLPVIGIIKRVYDDSDVYITPSMKEVDELMTVRPEIIALDATKRMRPGKRSLEDFFAEVRAKYPEQIFMADCSTLEEGLNAAKIGFDILGTTLSGYTSYSKGSELPNMELIQQLVESGEKPVIAEGGIWTPEQLKHILGTGVLAAVVGTAITRPMEITKRFVNAIE